MWKTADAQKVRKHTFKAKVCFQTVRPSGAQKPVQYKQVSNGQRAQDINIEHVEDFKGASEDFKGTSNCTRRSHLIGP